MELTVISAEDLKPKSSALFPRQLRPFVTLTLPSTNGDKPVHVYQTTVDEAGGTNPSWGDKFHIPLDHNSTSSFYQRQYYHPLIYLQLCTKDLMGGQTQLGWCQIPAADILDGLSPAGHVRRLSYRLRARDGCRGHGVVNIAVKLDGSGPVIMCPQSQRPSSSDRRHWPEMGLGQTVIGIPVRQLPVAETHGGKDYL
ncbi:BON1-associated protein 2-like [Rhododendron vialii]|uniref:BON1-associated protein 2-like n=1 Tax=Rhododendron vialii TaxID=182163 RepID=UPI00265E0AA3|nr:BON1-associated protein 2-like [Rhododendron vialii]